MKVYTKKGDAGETSLIGGTRVQKHHVRLDAYGTVDELNSWMGLLRDRAIHAAHQETILAIQDRLFTVGSLLAADPEKSKMTLPALTSADIEVLEQEIDRMEEDLPPLKSFVLPGGHSMVSECHIARSVCRRAERNTMRLHAEHPVQSEIIAYLNRLSDYLFVLSRSLAADLHAIEIPWKPRL